MSNYAPRPLYATLQVSRVIDDHLFLNDGDLGYSALGEVLGALLKALLGVGPRTAPLAWHLSYHSKEENPQVRTGVVGVELTPLLSYSTVTWLMLRCCVNMMHLYLATPVLLLCTIACLLFIVGAASPSSCMCWTQPRSHLRASS
jgi:hypothetical protein